MKKAILIICVLSLLALLVVSVMAEVLSLSKGLDGQAICAAVEQAALGWP